jgi:hypothetical protein
MGIKMMIYRMRIKDVAINNQGKVMDVEIPVVDCPKPSLGKGAALQNCLECESCKEISMFFIVCDFQSKQQADNVHRQAMRPMEAPKDVPPGVFSPKK